MAKNRSKRSESMTAQEEALMAQTQEAQPAPEEPETDPSESQDGESDSQEVTTAVKEKCQSEEQRKEALEKEALAVLEGIKKAAKKAESSYSVAWLHIGLQCLDFARKRMACGHGYSSSLDVVKAQLILFAPPSYAGNVDQVIRAGCVWRDFCESKNLPEKEREAVARALPWRTWFGGLSSLTQGCKTEEGLTDYRFLEYASEDVVALIDSCVKERFAYDDVVSKAGDVRRQNAENERQTKDQERRDAEALEREAREAELAKRKEKEQAEAAEKAAAAEARRLEEEAKDKEAAAQKAQEEAEAAEEAGDEEAAEEAAERAAIMDEASEAAKRAAQEAKEEEQRQKDAKEAADRAAREEREKIAENERIKNAAQRVVDSADKTIRQETEKADKRAARNEGASGKPKEKAAPKEEGGNLLDVAKKAAPADLASMMFAMLKANQMPFVVLKEFIEVLNSKDGAALFANDKMAQEVITAAVIAVEELGKPKGSK